MGTSLRLKLTAIKSAAGAASVYQEASRRGEQTHYRDTVLLKKNFIMFMWEHSTHMNKTPSDIYFCKDLILVVDINIPS